MLLHAPQLFPPKAFFQRRRIQRRQMDPGEAVFRCEKKRLGQVVTGDHLSLFLAFLQEFPGTLGGGGVVQVKYPNNGLIPHRHVVADGKIHVFPLLPYKLSVKFDVCLLNYTTESLQWQ